MQPPSIAGAGADQTVRVWDAEKGQELLALKGHTANVSSVCFSPDGKRPVYLGMDIDAGGMRVLYAQRLGRGLLLFAHHVSSLDK
jgi:WD40 repeat protein